MFPEQIRGCRLWFAFLCLRRGVSEYFKDSPEGVAFSLPTQRCFQIVYPKCHDPFLFSAYAEVFLLEYFRRVGAQSFLCLRRGVSIAVPGNAAETDFSLPTQRCFLRPHGSQSERPLFSAYAEVFPGEEPFIRIDDHFSLPTQRCFPVF